MYVPGLRMITVVIAVLAISGLAEAGPNELTTLPLHAVVQPASPPPCEIDDPCAPGPPTTTVPAGVEVAVYLLARNFDNMAGVQTAFDWGDWSLVWGSWSCQSNQIIGTEPHGAGGATAGTIATAFDCVIGPSTAIIGSLTFVTTSAGCLTQVESSFPFGTHVVSCGAAADAVAPYNRGRVCVAASGVDACETIAAQDPICDAGGPYAALEGQPVLFDGTGSSPQGAGAIVSYAWEFGDGQSAGGATVTHVYLDGGIFAVTLTVTDDHGAVTSCATTAEIDDCNPQHLTPVIGVDPSPLDFRYFPLSLCIDIPFALWNDVVDPCSLLEVEELSISGADFSLVAPPPTPFVIPGDGSIITLTIRVCPSTLDLVTGALTITATRAANSPVVVPLAAEGNLLPHCDANGPYTGEVGEVITFDGSYSRDHNGVIAYYAWEFGDGHTGAGAVASHIYADSTSSYFVTLCVTDDQDGESCCETYAYIGRAARVGRTLPRQMALHRCRPNPFNPSTTITFELPAAAHVTLRIYDSVGRQVRTLVDRDLAGGVCTVPWDGRNEGGQSMGSGIYIYRLDAGGRMLQRKMVLIR